MNHGSCGTLVNVQGRQKSRTLKPHGNIIYIFLIRAESSLTARAKATIFGLSVFPVSGVGTLPL